MSAPLRDQGHAEVHEHDHDAGVGGHDHDHDHDHGGGCGAEPVGVAIRLAPGERAAAVARARLLNRFSLAWNVTEGVIALLAGIAAGSVSLIGFGFDSAIEVSAGHPMALLSAVMRLATSTRNGIRLLSTILNGTPSRATF